MTGWARASRSRRAHRLRRILPVPPRWPVERYRRVSDLRKPGPGMITKLLAEWPVDARNRSWSATARRDMQAAAAAGIRGHLFAGGNLLDFVRRLAPPRRRIADFD